MSGYVLIQCPACLHVGVLGEDIEVENDDDCVDCYVCLSCGCSFDLVEESDLVEGKSTEV